MDRKRPLHVKISEDILIKIKKEKYRKDEFIPREVDLAKHYKVSRPTVRQAIGTLVDLGYLERKKGVGTRVKGKITQEFTHVIQSFDTEMEQKGLEPETKVLSFKDEKSTEIISEKLNIALDTDVFKLVRLRYASGETNVLVTSYIPKKVAPNLIDVDFTKNKLYTVLNQMGINIKTVERILDLQKADETTSDLLGIEPDDPIYYFQTIGYNDEDTPIEYSIAKYRGDVNSFSFKITQ